VNDRLLLCLAGEDAVNGLPLRGELFARKPGRLSDYFVVLEWKKSGVGLIGHTILTVLRRVELLDAGVAQLSKRHSCHRHSGSHGECCLLSNNGRLASGDPAPRDRRASGVF
jgi:hypothetical protein